MVDKSSVEIIAGVIHKINKKRNENSDISYAEELHPKDNLLEGFLNKMKKLFISNAYTFAKNFTSDYTIAKILKENYFDLKADSIDDSMYFDISKELTEALNHWVNQEQLTIGEHLSIIFYQEDQTKYLLISFIKLSENFTIDSESKQVNEVNSLDDEAIKVALLIDLDKMGSEAKISSNEEKEDPSLYIQWRQSKDNKFPEYAQKYIPIGVKIDSTKNTTLLINTIDKFFKCYSEQIDSNNIDRIRSRVLNLLKDKSSNQSIVNLNNEVFPIFDEFLNTSDREAPLSIKSYIKEKGITIDSQFAPDKKVVNRKTRFTINLEGALTIRGEQGDFNDKIHFFEETNNNKKKAYVKITLSDDELEKIKKTYSDITINQAG